MVNTCTMFHKIFITKKSQDHQKIHIFSDYYLDNLDFPSAFWKHPKIHETWFHMVKLLMPNGDTAPASKNHNPNQNPA